MDEIMQVSTPPGDDGGMDHKVVRVDPVSFMMTPIQSARDCGMDDVSPVAAVPSVCGSVENTPSGLSVSSPTGEVPTSAKKPTAPRKPKLPANERAKEKEERERLMKEKLAEKERLKAEKERERAEKDRVKAEKEKEKAEKDRLKAEKEAEKEKERLEKEKARAEEKALKELQAQQKQEELRKKQEEKEKRQAEKDAQEREKKEKERRELEKAERQRNKLKSFFVVKPASADSAKAPARPEDSTIAATNTDASDCSSVAVAAPSSSSPSSSSATACAPIPVVEVYDVFGPNGRFPPFQIDQGVYVAPYRRVPAKNPSDIDVSLGNFCDGAALNARALFGELKRSGMCRRRAERTSGSMPRKAFAATAANPNPVTAADSSESAVPSGKFKLLQFAENRRPAYFGTWSKTTAAIGGRRPFGKDGQHLDYEVDSDEDWESEGEGENISESDGEGEDVEMPAADDGADCMSEDDGFVVPHGYLSDDEGADADAEACSNASESEDPVTLAEGRRKRKWRATDKAHEAQAMKRLRQMVPKVLGGFGAEAVSVAVQAELASYRACFLFDVGTEDGIVPAVQYYDDEGRDRDQQRAAEKEKEKEKERLRELPRDTLASLARAVHGSSRGIIHLVDEFKAANPDFSKALIDENIRAIAAREKRPAIAPASNLSRWYVRDEVLAQLGLAGIAPKQSPPRERPPKAASTAAAPVVRPTDDQSPGAVVEVQDALQSQSQSQSQSQLQLQSQLQSQSQSQASKRVRHSPSAQKAKRQKTSPSDASAAHGADEPAKKRSSIIRTLFNKVPVKSANATPMQPCTEPEKTKVIDLLQDDVIAVVSQ